MDFPVYGLSTYGSHGSLSQTWYSEEDKCCYAVDQVPGKYHFDIRERDGIIRYIAFLVQMKDHAEELRLRFESVRESIVTKLSTSEGQESLRWTLDAQVKTYSVELESMLTWIPFNWE
uniref:14-alpha sterol demethylase Cyp51A (EC) n=1 Tax=Ganoderma boninense TaxID=34458 RepID=A0A5K1JZV9_9APHY|nr:14-alpha sterol demethylase Cyp51A (EC [Ganoderma boninense]